MKNHCKTVEKPLQTLEIGLPLGRLALAWACVLEARGGLRATDCSGQCECGLPGRPSAGSRSGSRQYNSVSVRVDFAIFYVVKPYFWRTYRSVVPSGVRPLPTHAHTERGPEDQGAPSSLQPHCTAPLGGGVHEDAGVAA